MSCTERTWLGDAARLPLRNDLKRLDRSNSEYRRHTKARASRSPASSLVFAKLKTRRAAEALADRLTCAGQQASRRCRSRDRADARSSPRISSQLDDTGQLRTGQGARPPLPVRAGRAGCDLGLAFDRAGPAVVGGGHLCQGSAAVEGGRPRNPKGTCRAGRQAPCQIAKATSG